jgi:hypothetical protein
LRASEALQSSAGIAATSLAWDDIGEGRDNPFWSKEKDRPVSRAVLSFCHQAKLTIQR